MVLSGGLLLVFYGGATVGFLVRAGIVLHDKHEPILLREAAREVGLAVCWPIFIIAGLLLSVVATCG